MEPEIDFGKIETLLNIIHKISTVDPTCTGILGAASDELRRINAAVADRRAGDAKRAAEHRAKQAAAAEASSAPKVIPSVPPSDATSDAPLERRTL